MEMKFLLFKKGMTKAVLNEEIFELRLGKIPFLSKREQPIQKPVWLEGNAVRQGQTEGHRMKDGVGDDCENVDFYSLRYNGEPLLNFEQMSDKI